MRLFIAVHVPEELRKKMAAIAKELDREGIRPVKEDNLHITLRFIGEVPDEKASEIEQALRQVKFGNFECTLRGSGVFPNESYVRVVWAGIESGGKLEELSGKVNQALAGFPGDEKFSAHLTLARVKKKTEVRDFLERHGGDFGSFTVDSFELIQSVLGPDGPKYTTVAVFNA
jgi:2'-5' RNA ligase